MFAVQQVIGLSYCGWDTRRRRKGSGLAVVPATSEGNDNDATGDGPELEETAGSMDTGDPEVIIARRNAEHRRMQVRLCRLAPLHPSCHPSKNLRSM